MTTDHASSNNTPTDISIIIPAFREEAALGSVVQKIQEVMLTYGRTYEILVIDDGSDDNTAAAARNAGATVIAHPYTIGNGAAVKTGIRNARGAYLVMLDGDGQHDPQDIPRLLEKLGAYDMVVGARTARSQQSFQRRLANRIYNLCASYICKRKIDDLTSGFRAIKTEIARRFVYLIPNTFSYPTTLTLAIVRAGHSLVYVPIDTKWRSGISKIRPLQDGARFFLIIIKIATLFSPMRVFLPVSVIVFLIGLGYGLVKIFFMDTRYGPTSAMLMTMAVVIFMVGLVSDQVAQLRFDRSEDRE